MGGELVAMNPSTIHVMLPLLSDQWFWSRRRFDPQESTVAAWGRI
jgi:hypothetical protein